MTAREFARGGFVPGCESRVFVVPYSKRGLPLSEVAPGWDPLLVITAEECILNRDLCCTRKDHPHARKEAE